MKTILTLLTAGALTGCGTTGNKIVPSNKFKDSEREVEIAQDSRAKDILIEKKVVDKHGNTNYVTIKITGLEGKNNPDVIDSAGKANAASVSAYAQLFKAGAEFGQDAFAKTLQAYAALNGVPVAKNADEKPVIPQNLIVEDQTYIPIQWPEGAQGRGVYIYEGPDGANYIRSPDKTKMIRLHE